jgi:hypothetical protein
MPMAVPELAHEVVTPERFAQGMTFAEYLDFNAFLNEKHLSVPGGTSYQSIPVAAFFTKDFRYLWHYIERPAVYHPQALSTAMQRARPGESREATWERFLTDWGALQQGPFFPIWALAAVDEMLSALHRKGLSGAGSGSARCTPPGGREPRVYGNAVAVRGERPPGA